MRYRLTTQPTVGPGKVTEELERLLKNARRLTTSLVVVGPPYKRLPMTATVLEVPDQFAQMATRVLEVILGPSGQSEPQLAVPMRQEWTKHALLVPQKGAQPLVESLFEGWSSVGLHLHWRPSRCVGIIHYCEGDAARVATLASHGWKARVLPAKVADVFAAAWTARVSHQPFLGKPLVTPTAQHVVAATSGGKSMTPTSLFTETQESVFQPSSSGGVAPRKPATTRPTGVGTVLAPRGGEGFPLGTTLDGQAIKLAWNALLLSVVAPEDRQRDLVLTLVTRAIQHDLGLIAVIPQSLVSSRQLGAWSTRVRTLDPRNLWESHAIPWHLIDGLLLREALTAAGVQASLPSSLPATFGEFLATVPGGDQYCTEAVLALTAPEGDDLRGVVEAGGGVLLIDDASPGGRLLSMLLFALLATDPQIERRMLLIRPAQIPVPAALAQRSIQVVFGEDPAALGTLRAGSDSWRLSHADGGSVTELDADLERPPSALDESSYGSLLNTLSGRTDVQSRAQSDALAAQPLLGAAAATASDLLRDDGDDLFATPFATSPRQAQPVEAEGDDLFTGSLDLTSPFASNGAAAAAQDDLFTFDSPAAVPTPAQPAAGGESVFNSFFNIPLDGDLALTPAPAAAPWTATSSIAPGAESALPHDGLDFAQGTGLDDFAGSYALPGDAATDNSQFADMFAQPLDMLASAPIASPAPETPPASASDGLGSFASADEGGLGYDPFATPLDFGGISATSAAADTPAEVFGTAMDSSQRDGIFPSFGADDGASLWDLTTFQPQAGLSHLDLPGLDASLVTQPADVLATPAHDQVWSLPAAQDAAVGPGLFVLPTGADETAAPAAPAAPLEVADTWIIPADFQGALAAPEAAASWASAPWISGEGADMVEQPFTDVRDAAGETKEVSSELLAAPAAPEPDDEGLDASETARQPVATPRRWGPRRRRGWQPPQRRDRGASGAADGVAAAEEMAERPGAGTGVEDLALIVPEVAAPAQPEDGDGPLDEVTLALTTGDLDLSAVPLFDGPEFALPAVETTPAETAAADDSPAVAGLPGQAFLAAVQPGEAAPELLPNLGADGMADTEAAHESLPIVKHDVTVPAELLDAAVPAAESAPADLATMADADDQPLILPISLDIPDMVDLHTLDLPAELAAPVIAADTALAASAPQQEAAAAADLPAAPAAPHAPALAAVPTAPVAQPISSPWAAPADLAFDADAVYTAWRGGTSMAELVDLVARANPYADRSFIRRTIRSLLDVRSAASSVLPPALINPVWSVGAPRAGSGADAPPAPEMGQATLFTAPAAPAWRAGVTSNGADQRTEPHQDALLAAGTAGAAASEATLDTAAHAPLASDMPLDTAAHAPLASNMPLDMAANAGMPAIAPATSVDEAQPLTAEQSSPGALLDTAHVDAPLPDGGDGLLSEEGIWMRWANNDELPDIIRAMCGYSRGRAADEVRNHVYRVVVPRIVAELDAEVLVTRLLDGRQPLRSQMGQLDELLKRMNRQAGPVTGVIREKTMVRLIASMREARAHSGAAA